MKRIVVIGDGMVGRHFTTTLREREPGWSVTVLAEENRPAYDRVRLSAYFDGATAADLSLGELDDGVDLRLGEAAVRVDRERHVVHSALSEYPYDALVIATGSYPFVPPIPGTDSPGCFVYRTLDDLEAIRDHAAGVDRGVVVGGGLLGLEAANALRLLGLDTTVVEFAPHLMPAQLDEAGGAVLRGHLEQLGIRIACGTAVAAVTTDAAERQSATPGGGNTEPPRAASGGLRLTTSDGTHLDTGLVVFAAGVRPRDAIGRDSGLAMAERGGITVDDTCLTSDPDVYAIGECAAVDGRCFGLVAPGYAMAEVVVDRLCGGDARFAGADTSTKLKLLGVDVASFGAPDGPLSTNYLDPTEGVYAKLALSDDARTLLGGILVGDTEPYGLLRASVGGPVPARLADLLARAVPDAELPDSAQICSCHAVTKSAITSAIAEGACDVASLGACTKAGSGCGSCVPLLKQLLADSGVSQNKAVCEHFAYSRAELFDIVRCAGITTFSDLIAQHGTGRGCEVCKPVVASILASLDNGHILDGEQAALQDTNDHFLANLQRNGTYSVVPRVPAGEITPEKLITIGAIARDYGLYTKITGAQRIDMFGARVEQLPAIWRRLVDAGFESGHAYGKALRTVKSCVGTTWCRYGVQDSVTLAIDLELRYRGLRSPHKLKSAVSGCARECAEARGKDFGIIATEAGWNLYVGGNGGFTPRHAQLLLSDLDTESLVRYIDRFLMFYVRTADRLQRTAAWLENLDGGLDYLREVIVDDRLGICAELDAAMDRHVASYRDEWSAVLEDPDKLSRFVSFVNAPETPDPSIRFDTSRGQPLPVMLERPRVRAS
ncbi:nitrite reductase large subunit NirB [Stackebrandtia nassauensis]|uniref:assimilatory sulfite reductase (ferredoxin) n=1 Tax=Stackebrandtia nassauensis (strain DSM 44728 / CIP 108903 / NRRL B-16338 / NBRC 102104 / LLR-40K-21) TaxID=446470 RepID=D3Q7C7_STANL|nr:nitrite reductase large subunit NirB [Stackebrandtia nassauensis]ADD42398.1 nitrite reductase (NAD(P)H), large subunit [Stackebrandtia nassauensis DSM 44728]